MYIVQCTMHVHVISVHTRYTCTIQHEVEHDGGDVDRCVVDDVVGGGSIGSDDDGGGGGGGDDGGCGDGGGCCGRGGGASDGCVVGLVFVV